MVTMIAEKRSDGIAEDCANFMQCLAMELPQACTESSIW